MVRLQRVPPRAIPLAPASMAIFGATKSSVAKHAGVCILGL